MIGGSMSLHGISLGPLYFFLLPGLLLPGLLLSGLLLLFSS